MLEFPILVGDIGGTNARFALAPSPEAEPVRFPVVATADHANIDEAIEATVLAQMEVRPRSALLAVAAPVAGEEIRLTNCPWTLRPRAMASRLRLGEILILNDFEAQALAAVSLDPDGMERIGSGTRDMPGPKVVLGPGTGLGVASLVPAEGRWVPVPGEGGHVDIGPRTAREAAIWPHVERIGGRVSGEQILCGRGLVNLVRAVAAADGVHTGFEAPQEVVTAALAGSDAAAVEALGLFVTCLGRLAGDLALTLGARGGVHIAGGIAPRIMPILSDGRFRAAFDDKAPHEDLMRSIPVMVMTDPLAAVAGLLAYARAPERFILPMDGRRWSFPIGVA